MALNTYSTLVSAVADWLARSDLTARIPDFLTLAEDRLNRELRIREMVSQATGSTSVATLTLPSDFIEAIRFALDTADDYPLEYRPIEDAEWRVASQTTGEGRYFTIKGTELRIYPTPDTSYDYTLDYYAKLSALSATNTSNAVLAKSPSIYLFATLCEAEPFLQNDDRTVVWEAKYQSTLASLNGADQRAKRSSGPQRMRVLV